MTDILCSETRIDFGDGQFSERCDVDGSFFNSDVIPITFFERLNIAIVAIIFIDHRERLFFDYFAHFENRLFCDYSRYARSARSGQTEKNSSLFC